MELQDVEKLRLLELIGTTLNGVSAKEQAERLVDSITDERLRRYAESRLASLLVEIGETRAAEEIARHMAQTARYSPAAFIFAKLAERSAGNPDLALEYLQHAEEAALADADVYSRSTTRERIVRGYASLAQWNHAQRVANEIEVLPDRIGALCSLAERANSGSAENLALELVTKAAELAAAAQQEEQAELLDEIARACLNLGAQDRAHAMWIEAASHALATNQDSSQLLLGICMALTSLGDHDRARDLAYSIQNQTRRQQALAITGIM